MTYDEYKTAIDTAVSNPDTGLAGLPSVLENLKTDLGSIETLNTTISEKDAKIRELQDTNMKLYMQIGGGSPEPDPDPDPVTGVGVIDEFMNELFTEEGNNNGN